MTKLKTKPFLILGFPRSKTAWLANYFTYGGVFCWHELSLNHSTDDIKTKLGDFNGNADSGLVFKPDWVIRMANTGAMRVLFVNRPKKEIAQSLSKAYNEENIRMDNIDFLVEMINFNLNKIKLSVYDVSPDRMEVDYHDMFVDFEKVHSFLAPQVPYDGERFELLKNLRVNQIISKRLEQADPNKFN